MQQKHVLEALDQVKSGKLGTYKDLSTKHYVIDPRDGTPWDLKAVVGLAKQLAGELNDLGEGKAHPDRMIKFLQRDAPDIVVLSFSHAMQRRLGLGENNPTLQMPDWADASFGKVTGSLDVENNNKGGVHRESVPSALRTIKQFIRSDQVQKAAVAASGGKCGDCKQDAPFKTSGGEPFLEVHHIVPLGKGGADTLDNVIALCPNCHRSRHYGPNGIA
jgi:HNH endonuclease